MLNSLWVDELKKMPMYQGWSDFALTDLVGQLWADLSGLEQQLIQNIPIGLQIDYLCLSFWHFGLNPELREYREAERKALWICGPLNYHASKTFGKVIKQRDGWVKYWKWGWFRYVLDQQPAGSWKFERLALLAYEVFLNKSALNVSECLSNLNRLDEMFFEMKNKARKYSWLYEETEKVNQWHQKERWESGAECILLDRIVGSGNKKVDIKRL